MKPLQAFLSSSFRRLFDQEPFCLVDVGAREGIHRRWQPAHDLLSVLAFEPDANECARLNAALNGSLGKIKYLPTALSRRAGQTDLHVTRSGGCSSFLEPNVAVLDRFPDSERYTVERAASVPTETLDRLQSELHYQADFLKVDVQGAELSVLEGAEKALQSSVIGLEIEVEFSELYKGQPLFGDLDQFLRKRGFVLFDLKRHWWKRSGVEHSLNRRGQLVFGEALYFKDLLAQPDALEQSSPRSLERTLAAAVLAALIYHKDDYALELLGWGERKGLFVGDGLSVIKKTLTTPSLLARCIAQAPGQYHLSKWLTRLGQRFKTHPWASSDDEI